VHDLQYVPIPEAMTADLVVAGYASAQLTNRMLEARISTLEAAVADARVRFRAIRCLEGTAPHSPEAARCEQAAADSLAALKGASP
jgi:hypothetical protein